MNVDVGTRNGPKHRSESKVGNSRNSKDAKRNSCDGYEVKVCSSKEGSIDIVGREIRVGD